jgi:hypothetical protein
MVCIVPDARASVDRALGERRRGSVPSRAMTADRMELRVGEERAVHLPSGGVWHAEIEGMASAVSVRKLWKADPYPDDDWGGDGAAKSAPVDEVFMVRATGPGSATVRFVAEAGGDLVREVSVTVRL